MTLNFPGLDAAYRASQLPAKPTHEWYEAMRLDRAFYRDRFFALLNMPGAE